MPHLVCVCRYESVADNVVSDTPGPTMVAVIDVPDNTMVSVQVPPDGVIVTDPTIVGPPPMALKRYNPVDPRSEQAGCLSLLRHGCRASSCRRLISHEIVRRIP